MSAGLQDTQSNPALRRPGFVEAVALTPPRGADWGQKPQHDDLYHQIANYAQEYAGTGWDLDSSMETASLESLNQGESELL